MTHDELEMLKLLFPTCIETEMQFHHWTFSNQSSVDNRLIEQIYRDQISVRELINRYHAYSALNLDSWNPGERADKAGAVKAILAYLENQSDELDLSGYHLSSLPSGFHLLESIVRLDLGDNAFTAIPKELFELPNLYDLNLSDNYKINIDDIDKCKHLSVLKVKKCGLTTLPVDKLNQLSLWCLDYSSNQVSSRPTGLIMEPDALLYDFDNPFLN